MSDLAVTIVSYRTPQLTREAVASALSLPSVREVVVVDNASGDQTLRLLSELSEDRLHVISNATNVGFGAAHNVAAKVATAPILILLNSDARLSADSASVLARQIEQDAGRSIIGPRLTSDDGSIQASAGLLPGPFDLSLRALGIHTLAAWARRRPIVGPLIGRSRLVQEHASAASATNPITTTMVSGACLGLTREAFLGLDGFDERYFMYFEDADLCRRALRAGMEIKFVPEAVVPHVGGASSGEDYHFSPRHARSMRLYLGKWYGPPGAALAVVLMFLRAVGFTIGAPRRAGRAWRSFGATLGFGGRA